MATQRHFFPFSLPCAISFLAVTCLGNELAQAHFVVTTWETDQGLPENSATSMVQDEQGFLWFGTANGLVRFDGIHFEVFDRTKLPALPSPAIVNLHLDQAGRFWVSTRQGLIVRDGGRWLRCDSGLGWEGTEVRHFSNGPDGIVSLATNDGHLLQFIGNRFKPVPPPLGTQQESHFIHTDSKGRLWALDSEFFGYWQDGSWNGSHPLNQRRHRGGNFAMTKSQKDQLWIDDGKTLWLVDEASVVNRFDLHSKVDQTWSMYEDRFGDVWIASGTSGLVHFDRGPDRWEHYSSKNLLSHNSLRFVFEDREGHIWIGSLGGGLMRFREPPFTTVGTPEGLNEPLVKSVWVDPDRRVMAATFGGGYNLGAEGKFLRISNPDKGANYAQSVLADRQNRVWIGSYDRGLYRLAPESNQLIREPAVPKVEIRASFEARNGSLWFGAPDRAYRLHEGNWTELSLPPGVDTGITCFAQAPDREDIYAGTTTAGLFRFDGQQFSRVRLDDRFDREGIASLLFLSEDRYLIGTFDLGLVISDQGKMIHLDHRREFPSSGISSFTRHQDALWIGTNRGIIRMEHDHLIQMIHDPTLTFIGQVFTQSDGLSSIECPVGFQPTVSTDRHGRIWFASGKGINSIKPSQLQLNLVQPPIVFEELSYLDASNSIQKRLSKTHPSGFSLPPDHSNITVKFTSPTFISPEKLMFETTLIGPTGTIRKRQSAREILFHRLPPGNYTLSVRARNSDGFWGNSVEAIQLSVAPFYWQRMGFKVGAAFGVIGFTGLVGFWVSRRQMMRHLESERRLKHLLEQTQTSAAIGGWEYDARTDKLFWTSGSYAIHHLDPTDFIPDLQAFVGLYHAPYQRQIRLAIDHAIEEGGEFALEVQTLATNEWLQITGKAVEGSTTTIYGCFQSIHQRKLRNEEEKVVESHRRQSQKLEAIGTLAGGIAHDFNNILTGIRGYTDLLDLDLPKSQRVSEHIKNLKDAAGRATELVKQILTYSRPSSEQLAPLDLAEVTRQALKLVRASIPSSIEIDPQFESEIPLIHGSESQIHQLLLNLFTNAAQAIGDLGAIRCQLYTKVITSAASHSLGDLHPGHYAILAVTDTGEGMSQDLLDRIFDPFFTTKQDRSGTGLGLSVVLGIVKNHNGAIRLMSEPHQGTTFRVYFPIAEETVLPSPPQINHFPAETDKRILLIDDDEAVRDVTSGMLRSLGHRFEAFSSGQAAVESFEQAPDRFDLIITDLSMPTMRGHEVIDYIRAAGASHPVILISGNLRDLDPDECEANGVTLLTKPYQIKELAEAITLAINPPVRVGA